MQRINFFSLPCEPGDLQSSSRAEAHRERRLRRARSSLESYHTCWFHRCIGDSADAVFHCALGFPQQGKNLRHVQLVPLSLSQAYCYLNRSSTCQAHNTKQQLVYVFFCTPDASDLSMLQSSLPIFHYVPAAFKLRDSSRSQFGLCAILPPWNREK